MPGSAPEMAWAYSRLPRRIQSRLLSAVTEFERTSVKRGALSGISFAAVAATLRTSSPRWACTGPSLAPVTGGR